MTSTWRNIPSHGAPEVISSPFQRSLLRDHLGITWVSIGVVKFLNSTYSKMGPHGPHLGLHFGQSTEFVREFLANIQLLIPISPPVELPSDNLTLLLKMAIEIVDLPMKKKEISMLGKPIGQTHETQLSFAEDACGTLGLGDRAQPPLQGGMVERTSPTPQNGRSARVYNQNKI